MIILKIGKQFSPVLIVHIQIYEADNIDKKDDNNDNKERHIFENREKLENIHINNDNDKKIKKS